MRMAGQSIRQCICTNLQCRQQPSERPQCQERLRRRPILHMREQLALGCEYQACIRIRRNGHQRWLGIDLVLCLLQVSVRILEGHVV